MRMVADRDSLETAVEKQLGIRRENLANDD